MQYGPIMHLQLGEVPAIVITSAELAQEVLKTQDHVFAQRPELLASKILSYDSTDLVFARGEYWKQMRKFCMTELLGAKKVKSLAPLREDEAWNLLETIRSAGGAPINLTEKIFWMTSVIAVRAAFGNKWEDQKDVISIARESLSLAGGFDLADLYPKREFLHVVTNMKPRLEKMRVKLDALLDRIVNEHKEKLLTGQTQPENEVLIDVLLRHQESGKLQCPVTIDNVKAVIWDMFVAGTDTSSTTTEWALSEMIRNPKVLKKAQNEVREVAKGKETIHDEDLDHLPYLKHVIKETLRLHPPVPLLLPRESNQDTEIDGYFIPKNTKVMINAWAIGRDSAYWEDPENFKPERFNDNSIDFKGTNCAYIPFGGGRRICPGMSFGLANVELPLAKLLYHFDYKLPNGVRGEDLDMTEAFGATVGRKDFLYVIATPYVPSN
uniref:Cytochrome p450 n=1 Tax=Croton stellatopilosus TaxID=431156 RepID=A0A3G2CJV7_9ROSI|nr:cytochrome p450 [Croton stellatopilosus]